MLSSILLCRRYELDFDDIVRWELLDVNESSPRRVLDIGCGNSEWGKKLAELEFSVCSMDVDVGVS